MLTIYSDSKEKNDREESMAKAEKISNTLKKLMKRKKVKIIAVVIDPGFIDWF